METKRKLNPVKDAVGNTVKVGISICMADAPEKVMTVKGKTGNLLTVIPRYARKTEALTVPASEVVVRNNMPTTDADVQVVKPGDKVILLDEDGIEMMNPETMEDEIRQVNAVGRNAVWTEDGLTAAEHVKKVEE